MYSTKTAPWLPVVNAGLRKPHSLLIAIGLVGLVLTIAPGNASAQTAPPADQIVYTSGTATLPSSTSSTGQLLFNSVNPALVPSAEQVITPSLFVQKLSAEHGIFIVDNNPSDSSFANALNIEMFNITSGLTGNRGGIRVHVDPSNSSPPVSGHAFANLAGIEVGNHAPYAIGLYVLTQGPQTAIPTQGVGIVNQSWGKAGIWSTEGDPNNVTSTEGAIFLHSSTGHILDLYHTASNLSNDFIHADASADGTGSFTGNFLDFDVKGNQVFKVDANGNVTIPSLKAASGTRFICIDINGKLVSQTTACSGT